MVREFTITGRETGTIRGEERRGVRRVAAFGETEKHIRGCELGGDVKAHDAAVRGELCGDKPTTP